MRRGTEEFGRMLARLGDRAVCAGTLFRYIAGGKASGSGERAGAAEALDRRSQQDAAHRPAADGTLEGSVGAHLHRQRVRQPPRHLQNRFHERSSRRSVWLTPNCATIRRAYTRRAISQRATNAAGRWSESRSKAAWPSWTSPAGQPVRARAAHRVPRRRHTRPIIFWQTGSRNWKLP